ncbi:hypothetical protein RI129_008446 [Pyrocoelia pectoralis]|uniref:Ankyrin repeat domain-containing protein 54 n=1 Tax=Pyrocoelia pectoralis TaxID=417401 RepID=A0AAN7V9X2_9COLE
MSSYSDSELKKIEIKNKLKKSLHVPLKAKRSGTLRTIKTILKEGHIPDLHQRRLLTAVCTNNTDLLQEMLAANVSPNSKDRQQRSALHIAVSRGYADAVCLLLQHGADVNSQDILGNTPLHLAACTSNLQIITHLLNAGANINSLDMHGRNPRQLAESKLHILRHSWKSRTIEMTNLREQLQQIVNMMISLWRRKSTENVNDLEIMKLSIGSGEEDDVDTQMARLLDELRDFTLK